MKNDHWWDVTWNVVSGCSPISSGCAHCWANRFAKRLAGRYGYPKDAPFRVTFHPERLEEPLRIKKPRRIFVSSMGDFFHWDVKPEWIDAVLDVMAACPQHTFIILTKRPEFIDDKLYEPMKRWPVRKLGPGDFLSNLMLGVSVEDQPTADKRIPELLKIPAAKHIISIEPMLGPVNVRKYLYSYTWIGNPIKGAHDLHVGKMIKWVILGGETGPGARPMHPDWARAVRDQCKASGTAFFFKQMSGKTPIPEDLMIREFPYPG